MVCKCAWFAGLILASLSLFAQTTAPDETLAHAKSVYEHQGARAALPEFEKALAAYRAASDRRGEAITLGLIGNCHKQMGDYPRALDLLQRALALKRELRDRPQEGRTLNHLGLVYWEMAEYPKAVEVLSQSIAIAREINDRQLEAAALNNVSLVYDEMGDYRRSLEQYQQALALHRQTGYEPGQSDTLGNIGGVYMLLGRYSQAMQYYRDALAISERLKLKASASKDLGNLALCELGVGDLNGAVATFDRALALAREAGLKKDEADWYKGKASALLRQGKFDLALENYRLAREKYETAGLKQQLVEAFNDIGYAHLELGDRVDAERDFRRAATIAIRIGHERGVVANALALADLQWRSGEYGQAMTSAKQALARARKLDDSVAIASALLLAGVILRDQGKLTTALLRTHEALERAQRDGIRPIEAQALEQTGDLLRRQGKPQAALLPLSSAEELANSSGDVNLMWRVSYGQAQALETLGRTEDAIAAYRHAITTIQGVREQIHEQRFRTGYIEDKQQVYVALVRLLLRLGRVGEAFEFSEKLREQSYLDLLDRRGDLGADRQTAELRARIRQLQELIEKQKLKPQSQQRSEPLRNLSDDLAAAEREYQAGLDDQRASRATAGHASQIVLPNLDGIRHVLPQATALIEYVLAKDELAVLVITPQAAHGKLVKVRSVDLQAKVELLRDLIAHRKGDEWRAPAESLGGLLIGSIEREGWVQGAKRLYIVPHGILHYVPFAALPRQRRARPLIDDYEIAYMPAAASLISHDAREPVSDRMLALAPARSGLRFALPEARGIAGIFAAHGQALVGRQATETAFREIGGKYDFLHFATHAYFNKASPLFSGLQLEADAQNDGRLEVYEILGLELKARLVALSACDTALAGGYFNEIPAGDEFVGLTRAFLEAGSGAVLATLWDVNDRSTLLLMRRLYRSMANEDALGALARAQRSMLTDPRYRHPYYWAPFVLVGSNPRTTRRIAEKR